MKNILLTLLTLMTLTANSQSVLKVAQGSQNSTEYQSQPQITWNAILIGEYPLIGGLSIKDVFTPTTTDVDTYNHHIHCAKYYDEIHIIFTTHENAEIGYGSRIRYSKSSDNGETWSVPVVLLEAQDDSTKDYTVLGGRQSIATDFAVYNNELYAIVDVNDLTVNPTTRIGVGVLAIKINQNATFGTPVWIDTPNGSFIAPTEVATFPIYFFDEPLRTSIKQYLNNGVNNPISYFSVPNSDPLFTRLSFDSNTMAEPTVTKFPNGQYVRLWKDGSTSVTDWKVAQTGENGITWNEPYITGIPDVNARTRIHKLKTNEVCLIGNNQGSDRDPLYFALSFDGFTYESADVYQIDKSLSGAVFSGQGKGRGAQHQTKIIELDNGRILIGYDINKEDVKVAIFDKPILN